MLLTKDAIQIAIDSGEIEITPYNAEQLNPNSYDLRLSSHLATYAEDQTLDAANAPAITRFHIPKEGIVLRPEKLYLGATEESTYTGKYVPGIEGRSSVGRLGIHVHATAGFGDVGFRGTWTLEISVVEPVRVYAGMRLCQIYWTTCTPIEYDDMYSGKYRDQVMPQPSSIFREREEWHT